MDSQLETYHKAIETSPSHMVEQFVLLHSNYLDEAAQSDGHAAYEKYKGKIAAIQGLCTAALEHKAVMAKGGKQHQQPTKTAMRHRKTKKKRAQIR